jgi:hypothetical protein
VRRDAEYVCRIFDGLFENFGVSLAQYGIQFAQRLRIYGHYFAFEHGRHETLRLRFERFAASFFRQRNARGRESVLWFFNTNGLLLLLLSS